MRSRDVAEAKPRRSRGAISPASIVTSLAISRIVCIGTYSILCDFGADTSFYAQFHFYIIFLCNRIYNIPLLSAVTEKRVSAAEAHKKTFQYTFNQIKKLLTAILEPPF